jgi:hypothetical protein
MNTQARFEWADNYTTKISVPARSVGVLTPLPMKREVETKDGKLIINIKYGERLTRIQKRIRCLTADQLDVLTTLAEDWHGTTEDLINAAKELTR